MSRIRRAFVVVVSGVIAATAIGAVLNQGTGHRPPTRPTALIRSAPPLAAAATAGPGPGFNADGFLTLVGRLDPAVANDLIETLSPADRAAIATDLAISTGLRAG